MGNIIFGKSLKRIRQHHHESQTDLANVLGVARSAISMYESGSREPAFEILEAIADHYNVNMSQLLGESPQQPDSLTKENSPGKDELTEGEKMLLDLFRMVPAEKQQLVLDMIRAALKMQQ